MRTIRLVTAALVLVATACTSTQPNEPGPSSGQPQPTEGPAGTLLASGEPLPTGCHGKAGASQTVAFVAEGRAWALDPDSGRLSCLFEDAGAEPLIWGPQGDRVLIGGLVRELAHPARDYTSDEFRPEISDWGHPIGKSIVYTGEGLTKPQKLFMDDKHIEALPALPAGRYLDIAYHPSGLALAFVIERGGKQAIWFSSNEGTDPKRLVFSRGGTTFSSLAFTKDGKDLYWLAQHPGGYSQVHRLFLGDPGTPLDDWRGGVGETAREMLLSPDGRRVVNVADPCTDGRAIATTGGEPALLPEADQPTAALGWLDGATVLVAEGPCQGPFDLYAVEVGTSGEPTLLVSGVDSGASRVAGPRQAEPPPVDVGLLGGSGVG